MHSSDPSRRRLEERYYAEIDDLETAIERNAEARWRVLVASRVAGDKYMARYVDDNDPPAQDGPL